VGVVLSEGVDRLFHEDSLDEVEAITQLHHWDKFVEVEREVLLEI